MYQEAERICASKGLRLCSRREVVEEDVCCNTGCGYDDTKIWLRDEEPSGNFG